jgi:hypothetical protein
MAVLTNTAYRQMKAQSVSQIPNWYSVTTQNTILVYSGTMPAINSGASFNLATYASQLLVGFNNYSLGAIRTSNYIAFATPPGAATATATGTAGWVVMQTGITSYTTGSTSVYMVGEPSLTNDNGLIQLSTLSIVSGQSVTALSLYLAF